MLKKSRKILLIGGVLAAVSFGGSALAAAGAAPVQPTTTGVSAKATAPTATSSTTDAETADGSQKSADAETADGPETGQNEADGETADDSGVQAE